METEYPSYLKYQYKKMAKRQVPNITAGFIFKYGPYYTMWIR